jgi:hypothetical protein
MRKMKPLIALLAFSSMVVLGCASHTLPEEAPYYTCLLLFGNKFRCYPRINAGLPELTYKASDAAMVGSMCLRPEDYENREVYIMEIEERLKSK